MSHDFRRLRARILLRIVPLICLPASLGLAGTGEAALWPSPALGQMFTNAALWGLPLLASGLAFCLVQRHRPG